jgi:hypothetical protein
MNTNDYMWETTNLDYVAYLQTQGFDIGSTGIIIKNGKKMISFTFYDNYDAISNYIRDYINSDICKFMQTRNELLTLVRQTSRRNVGED